MTAADLFFEALAYAEGRNAFLTPADPASPIPGWGKPGNPHPSGTPECDAWARGYRDALAAENQDLVARQACYR